MDFNKFIGLSHTDDEAAVGADSSRLYLSPRQDSADLSAQGVNQKIPWAESV